MTGYEWKKLLALEKKRQQIQADRADDELLVAGTITLQQTSLICVGRMTLFSAAQPTRGASFQIKNQATLRPAHARIQWL